MLCMYRGEAGPGGGGYNVVNFLARARKHLTIQHGGCASRGSARPHTHRQHRASGPGDLLQTRWILKLGGPAAQTCGEVAAEAEHIGRVEYSLVGMPCEEEEVGVAGQGSPGRELLRDVYKRNHIPGSPPLSHFALRSLIRTIPININKAC